MKGLKLIGKGSFTKCYLNTCEETVTLISCDPIKECMSQGWFPESSLFPKVEHVDVDEKSGNDIYTMRYYPKTRSLKNTLKPEQYEIYKQLRKLMESNTYVYNKYDSYSLWYEKFSELENKELRETMLEALDACNNYGSDVAFEISPRNVAVDNGNLVLLDCFFLKSMLNQIR